VGSVPTITLLPFLHGKAAFAQELRRRCLQTKFDCIAVDLPNQFEPYLADAVSRLPEIHALVAREAAGPLFYLPIDPCDVTIEAIRQSFAMHIPFRAIGVPVCEEEPPLPLLPDAYAISSMGFDAYTALCIHALEQAPHSAALEVRGAYLAQKIQVLQKTYSSILVVVHLRHVVALSRSLAASGGSNEAFPPLSPCSILTERINPDHLYFALGELPFITGKYEQERYDLLAAPYDSFTAIKDLFRETRETFATSATRAITLSPVRIQAALTYLRNLTVLSSELLPSLFDIIEAAKGVGGNAYALQILKNARYYPWIALDDKETLLAIGIDRMRVPAWGITDRAVNIFKDFAQYWRTISLRPDPTDAQKTTYRYTWNPHGMCSHTPEDVTIEQFNGRVRNKALKMLLEDHATSEKFNTSVKDGIDIRETVRHWHTGDLYVRELPPARGKIDSVVIIFDAHNDARYPHCTTWYAEHPDESTLAFYATGPFENLIGPGIARCEYGGLSLLFPPRQVPDIFQLKTTTALPDRASQLTLGALLFSTEKHVAYVASEKPSAYVLRLAHQYKKRLIWIPLASFSHETIVRLRTFHILNGKEVRSWATRFIGDQL